jgi:UDP-N-acetylglucosamine 2-epimerase (non-hydrolysing)
VKVRIKIATVLGTRPEITKLSPVLPLLDAEFENILIHTGQHYDYNMDRAFFEELRLRDPDYKLNVGSGTHAVQTGNMMIKIEEVLMTEKPRAVVVFADPNTPLAGALAAVKLGIPVIHMEAGCRSFNKNMPEEVNRILVDHCSSLLLAPDRTAHDNLIAEGVPENKIKTVGSTVFDVCARNKVFAEASKILERLNITPQNYIVATIHRAENTDNLEVLRGLISAFNAISKKRKIIFSIHPRTKKRLEATDIKIDSGVVLVDALTYFDFLKLLYNSQFVMTDSGGIQEEAAAFNIPAVVTRNETEWTYLTDAGKNVLASTNPDKIVKRE